MEETPKLYYYVCEHGESNVPCICHKLVDRNVQEVPDDWYITYAPEGPPGMTDSVDFS